MIQAPHPVNQALADYHLALYLLDGDTSNYRCVDLRSEALAAAGCDGIDPDNVRVIELMTYEIGGHTDTREAIDRIQSVASQITWAAEARRRVAVERVATPSPPT